MKKLIVKWNLYIKGLQVEIVQWGYATEEGLQFLKMPIWNSYIYIDKRNLEEDFKKLFVKRGYQLDNYFDMYCGISFYEKHRSSSGVIDRIQVGCDYNHFWDIDSIIDYPIVLSNLEKSVDCFIRHFPDYKVECQGNGKYYKPTKENGILIKEQSFRSFEYFGKDKLIELEKKYIEKE